MPQKQKKVVVIGASTDPDRYSNIVTVRLLQNKYEVVPIGTKKGIINDTEIITNRPEIENVHTVTLYINPRIQPEYYDYILKLRPKRIIFNPGTENIEFEKLAALNGIEAIEACNLVMLATKTF
jgi:predicted CoA-binding protein